jgi:pre-mRNA-splicing factor SYF1
MEYLPGQIYQALRVCAARVLSRILILLQGGSKLERTRDLFEQALEKCPEKHCKPLFLMYAKLEEDYGRAKRVMEIYERATKVVMDEDKYEVRCILKGSSAQLLTVRQMFLIYIAKATENFGLPATRAIYERAITVLSDKQTAQMCLRFAAMERKLGEIDRARAIYAHASQFCDPRVNPEFWKEWNDFEVETGSEDTFKEFLRIRRSVQSLYNTEVQFLAAHALTGKKDGSKTAVDGNAGATADPMAMVETQASKTAGGPSFVKAKLQLAPPQDQDNAPASPPVHEANVEEIQMSGDED